MNTPDKTATHPSVSRDATRAILKCAAAISDLKNADPDARVELGAELLCRLPCVAREHHMWTYEQAVKRTIAHAMCSHEELLEECEELREECEQLRYECEQLRAHIQNI